MNEKQKRRIIIMLLLMLLGLIVITCSIYRIYRVNKRYSKESYYEEINYDNREIINSINKEESKKENNNENKVNENENHVQLERIEYGEDSSTRLIIKSIIEVSLGYIVGLVIVVYILGKIDKRNNCPKK